MNEPGVMEDRGGRRSGKDRRQFVYSGHIPERRSGVDRRSGSDRRSGLDRRARGRSSVADMAMFEERRLDGDRRRLPPPYITNRGAVNCGTV
ncbi:MAG: hypothetical protein K9M82_00610 [Deltaproteobacteria bacterium]|nr:hypothetical protein [Deltaproteobacteria bacterium]